ncbi:TIR domain-containing protein [Pleomorphomonas sp. PLEO]|uniref:TIR domain-containing protein n=1 Tax=Pleomorphomonas sp. PLEO TaxID=3239306 RepID=UPI00351DFDAD
MRRVIDGVMYDTDKAEEIGCGSHDSELSDAAWCLYRTPAGAFFMVEADHAGVVDTFRPVSAGEARKFVERWANSRYEDFWPTTEPIPIGDSFRHGQIAESGESAGEHMRDEIQTKKFPPFPSRALVIAAANMLKAEGHSGFEALRLEYDLLQTNAGLGAGLAARSTSLATFALENPEARTPDGIYLQSAIVARAGELYRSGTMNNIGEKERDAFKKASSAAGTMNDVSESGNVIFSRDNESTAQLLTSASTVRPTSVSRKISASRKVFVVHGHDKATLETVARFLERIRFEAIILHEQANQGRTIIEKIETHGDVDFAVVLLTPDDVGATVGGEQKPRARQNVILELGYFIAKLGRQKVCVLKRDAIELPSDFAGIVYQTLDEGGGWRNALARELEEVGFEIDWRKVGRS